jgi:signal transduction histidine kinase
MFADSNMIRTVIRNLLSNAIKFTPRKGNIKIKAFEKSRQIIIEVIDSGIGISPEQLPKIFSLSNDFSSLGTERERGTGLGLILCYEFIAINNGSIEAESMSDKGSTFRIYLPQFSMAN